MIAKLRSDKRKNPEYRNYRALTYAECRNLSGHADVLDQQGNVARVKITSVKTWKTRPDVEVHWKYGLYEYGIETVYPDREQAFFVIEI